MARYKLILTYDGTRFHGSQRQLNVRTVQGVVEDALWKLGWTGTSVLMAGRTDAGVHAVGQVVAFDFDWNHLEVELLKALNALLPEDVAVSQAEVIHDDFHPRYHARSRGYQYCIYMQASRNPMLERYAWRVWPVPEIRILQATADHLKGVHDFAAFGNPMQPDGNTIRELISASWKQTGEMLYFDVQANAFLYHMVRRLVSSQIKLAQGWMDMQQLLNYLHRPEAQIQGLAPPQGLTLVSVHY